MLNGKFYGRFSKTRLNYWAKRSTSIKETFKNLNHSNNPMHPNVLHTLLDNITRTIYSFFSSMLESIHYSFCARLTGQKMPAQTMLNLVTFRSV